MITYVVFYIRVLQVTSFDETGAPIACGQAGNNDTGAFGVADKLVIPDINAYMIDLILFAHAEHDQIAFFQLRLAGYLRSFFSLGLGAPWNADSIFLEHELCKGRAVEDQLVRVAFAKFIFDLANI